MPLLKNGFLEKIETWHVGLSCQYTHFMSFSSKSEHETITDQATLKQKQRNISYICPIIEAVCFRKSNHFLSMPPSFIHVHKYRYLCV